MNDTHHPLNALPQGHRLQEYELVRVLGFGGFGMTYLGFDHNLDKAVAIKEYLPSDIATRTGDNSVAPQASQFRDDFEWGLDRFLDEARTLARFDHRHIIKVHRYFQAHGTAYIVMEYAEGDTLSEFLQSRGTLTEDELKAILYPVLKGLEEVHRVDFLHRDIKPANIIIRDEDDSPVLLDFGAARQAIGTRSRSITSIITPGYAPIEQYSSGGNQGPWTDIYALGAVCYQALTGQVPNDATERTRRDPLLPASERYAGQASTGFLSAIDRALQVNEEDRPQNIAEWRAALGTGSSVSIPPRKPLPTPPPEGQDRQGEDPPSDPSPKKSRVKLFATIACLLAVLIGGVSYYQYEYVPNQRLKAQAAAEAERLRQSKITGYEEKFEEALGDRDYDKAEGYIDSLRAINADGTVLSELSGRLSGAREAERQRQVDEAEQARQAAEEAERQSKMAEYEGKFEEALGRNDFDMADRYVDSLRAVNAEGTMLSSLSGRLSTAHEEQIVGRRFRDCVECPEMVVVPSGSFTMGSPNNEEGRYDREGPRHRVNIGYPLAVGVYEVTFSEWEACVADGGCGGYRPSDGGWGRGNRPVINVSWKDAQSYVRWLSARTDHRYGLLSESEWEYVARAGTTTPFHFGSTISTFQANYDGDYTYGSGRTGVDRGKTVPVGSFSANGWGVHDMHGNVWEWVEDCRNDSYEGAPADGSAWESGDCDVRVLRGGSWYFEPWYLRSAARYGITTEVRNNHLGFRVIRRF